MSQAYANKEQTESNQRGGRRGTQWGEEGKGQVKGHSERTHGQRQRTGRGGLNVGGGGSLGQGKEMGKMGTTVIEQQLKN